MKVHPSLVLAFHDYGAVLQRLLNEFPRGGIFVPHAAELPVGQRYCVDVAFARDRVTVQSPGVVRWRRHRGGPGMPVGAAIEFLGEANIAARLRALARGSTTTLAQRARRFLVEIPTVIVHRGAAMQATTRDLSRTGLFLLNRTPDRPALAIGTQVGVVLNTPLGSRVAADALVSRHEDEGLAVQLVHHAQPAIWDALLREIGAAAGLPPQTTSA